MVYESLPIDSQPSPTIDYWMNVVLPLTQNSYSATNTSGWTYRVDTIGNKLYERENIIDYSLNSIDEYDIMQTYYIGDYARDALDVYVSKTNDNIGNSLSDSTYWELFTTLTDIYDRLWEPVYGASLEKARILTISNSNVFNIIQLLAEKFQIQVSFEYTYDSFYRIIGRTIVFKQDSADNLNFGITYGTNLKTISRTVDNNDFVTKMYVTPIDSEFEDDGAMFLSNAPQNLIMEDFLYNFNYSKDSGIISQDQYEDFITFQNNLRLQNIALRPIDYEIMDKTNEFNLLQADYKFIEYQRAAAEENAGNLIESTRYYESGVKTLDAPEVYYSTLTTPFYFNLSSPKGISPTGLLIATMADVLITEPYTATYDKDDPNTIIGLSFTTDQTGGLYAAKFMFSYNTVGYLEKLHTKEVATIASLDAQANKILARTTVLDGELTTLSASRNVILNEKEHLINEFESSIYYAIKEGFWDDSDYILKKISFVVDNAGVEISDETSTTAFIVTDDLNLIDFNSLHLWLMDGSTYLYEYRLHSDYELNYGQTGVTYGLIFTPEMNPLYFGGFYINRLSSPYDTTLTSVTNLNLVYSLLDGTPKSVVLTKSTVDVFTRIFPIGEVNVFPSSLKIVTHQETIDGELVDQVLEVNVDYTYEVFDTYSLITFKTTQKALHLDHYYSISYDVNNTLKSWYADAEDTLTKNSQPNVSYQISAIELSSIAGFEFFIPEVGKKVFINDPELKLINVKGFISEINYDLDNPENTQITITNYENIGEAQHPASNIYYES